MEADKLHSLLLAKIDANLACCDSVVVVMLASVLIESVLSDAEVLEERAPEVARWRVAGNWPGVLRMASGGLGSRLLFSYR